MFHFLYFSIFRSTRESYSLNAREVAPAGAGVDMFQGDSSLSSKGPLSIAVPGEIAGYWEARRRFGNPEISWQRILQPTIDMCRTGVQVSHTMAGELEDRDFTDEEMRKVFLDPSTGEGWKEGDHYTRVKLADTLEMLAEAGDDGDDVFYNGTIAEMLIYDLQERGGILTLEDLASYHPQLQPPLNISLASNLTLLTQPPPGSGAVLAAILNIMSHYETGSGEADVQFYHHLVESFKWSYGARTQLGDPSDEYHREDINNVVDNITSATWARKVFERINDTATNNDPGYYGATFYNIDDHGTAHLSIVDQGVYHAESDRILTFYLVIYKMGMQCQ